MTVIGSDCCQGTELVCTLYYFVLLACLFVVSFLILSTSVQLFLLCYAVWTHGHLSEDNAREGARLLIP